MSTFTPRVATWADVRPGAIISDEDGYSKRLVSAVNGDVALSGYPEEATTFETYKHAVDDWHHWLIRPGPYVLTKEDVELMERATWAFDPHATIDEEDAKKFDALITKIKESTP